MLDPTFWAKYFANFENISIVEKGPIHAWTYRSVATVHSGCTTGLEAFGADKATFDISGLVGPRLASIQSSLISKSQKLISKEQVLRRN